MIRASLVFFCFTACHLARAASDLPLSPEEVRPLAKGSAAPAAAVISLEGAHVDLGRVLAEKPTVLIFYRGGWCPFCNRHLAALAENEIKLRTLGFQIVGVTPDAPEQLKATLTENHLRYRLFSDRAMNAAGAYHVAYRLSREAGENYRDNGITLPVTPDGSGYWQPIPAAFIIGRDGMIRFVYSNPDPANSIEVEKLLEAAKEAAK